MVLQTLDAMGPLDGYDIARRIQQLSGNEILLNQRTIYAQVLILLRREVPEALVKPLASHRPNSAQILVLIGAAAIGAAIFRLPLARADSLGPNVDRLKDATAPSTELRWHDGVTQPVTFGIRRPVVLLPRRSRRCTSLATAWYCRRGPRMARQWTSTCTSR
jgi:hypothetical protein